MSEYVEEARYKADQKVINERFQRDFERLNNLEREQTAINELCTTVAVLAQRQETVESDVSEIKSDVKRLIGQPGTKWNKLIEAVIIALGTAFVCWIAAGTPGLN